MTNKVRINKDISIFQINSLLFVPAVKDKFYSKILALEDINKPDGIIFDLEDSICEKYKKAARKVLLDKMRGIYHKKIKDKYLIIIRVNSIHSSFFKEDLKLVNKINPDILMIPKVNSKKDVIFCKKIFKKSLFILVESIEGFLNIKDILSSMRKNKDTFALGYEDLSAELLIDRPQIYNSLNPITFMMMYALIISRYYDIPMFDAVYRRFKSKKDLKDLEKECQYTAELGMNGKLAIHPNQAKIINDIFEQNKRKKLNSALRLLELFSKIDDGVSVLLNKNREMIDTPSFKMANKILKYLNK